MIGRSHRSHSATSRRCASNQRARASRYRSCVAIPHLAPAWRRLVPTPSAIRRDTRSASSPRLKSARRVRSRDVEPIAVAQRAQALAAPVDRDAPRARLVVGSQRNPEVARPRRGRARRGAGTARSQSIRASCARRCGRSRSSRRGRCGRRPRPVSGATDHDAATTHAGSGQESPACASCMRAQTAGPARPQTSSPRARATAAVALDKGQDLATVLVEPEHAWSPVEPDRLEMPQQRVDRRRVRAQRAAYGVTDPNDDVLAELTSPPASGTSGSREIDLVAGQLLQAALLLRVEHRAHRVAHGRAPRTPRSRDGSAAAATGNAAAAQLVARVARAPALVRVGAVGGR